LHGIDRFDPEQGVRFETYALQRIRGAIIDTIRSLSPLSRGAGRRARMLDETAALLAQQLGRAPTQEELARELGVDIGELGRMLLESAHVIVSLPPRDRLVLNLYYHEELTLKEISRVIEVSESRVSQIHTAAVMKLRALLRTTQLARAA
jgi:RNA polymerase sigma factor for flagellar operon FliA